jgi:hypothetical protein
MTTSRTPIKHFGTPLITHKTSPTSIPSYPLSLQFLQLPAKPPNSSSILKQNSNKKSTKKKPFATSKLNVSISIPQVVLLLCHLRPQYSLTQQKKSQPQLLGMTALAVALPPPSVHEIRLECDMFVTRINFDFRIAHCEPK